MEVKNTLSRFYKWEYFWLCLILVVTLAMHFSIITSVKEMVLDEQHYVKDAQNIIANHNDLRPEHPPLAKLFIVGGIDALGDNNWGWRVPSIIMGHYQHRPLLFHLPQAQLIPPGGQHRHLPLWL